MIRILMIVVCWSSMVFIWVATTRCFEYVTLMPLKKNQIPTDIRVLFQYIETQSLGCFMNFEMLLGFHCGCNWPSEACCNSFLKLDFGALEYADFIPLTNQRASLTIAAISTFLIKPHFKHYFPCMHLT